MSSKWKVIVPVGIATFALVCVFGGRALVDRENAAKLDELKAQETAQQTTPSPETTPIDGTIYVKGNISTATASPAPAPVAASSSPAKETITVDEDGTVIITPDFAAQANSATKIITPDAQVSANMGGSGGGELPLGEDGAYHGDNPATPAPKATSVPQDTPQAPDSSSTAQEGTDNPGGGSTAPDSEGGHKNGEISSDGKSMWIDGMGWIDRSSTNGGMGGDDSELVTGGLTGNKVGNM